MAGKVKKFIMLHQSKAVTISFSEISFNVNIRMYLNCKKAINFHFEN